MHISVYNIMQPISQLPEPQQNQDYYRMLKSQSKTTQRINLTLIAVHQLDCIYYGEINRSYQKQGFGILQTLTFQTYFGFWKNNKVEGLGLILYPTGEIIYGQFSRNVLNGIGIVDDGRFLRLGVYQGLDLSGVGFEYTYDTSKWRMIKYIKGSPVEHIRQQVFSLNEGIPDMIAAQHSLYLCLSSYLKKQFFLFQEPKIKKGNKVEGEDRYRHLNDVLVSSKEHLIAIGFRDEGGMHGIGAIFNFKDKIMIQSGFFVGNELSGYCLQTVGGTSSIIGPFYQGMKHGHFIKTSSSPKVDTIEFVQDKEVGPSILLDQQITKKQKSYNFEQKDFLSAKNSFEFTHVFQLFTPPEVRLLRSKSKSRVYENRQQNQKTVQLPRTLTSGNGKKPKNQDKNPQTPVSNAEKTQRSCVDILRQKLRGYEMIKNEQGARLSSEQKRKRILNSNYNIFNEAEESIAMEQNPFDSAVLGINLLRSSPQRKH